MRFLALDLKESGFPPYGNGYPVTEFVTRNDELFIVIALNRYRDCTFLIWEVLC